MQIGRRPRIGIIARPIEQGTSGSGIYLSQLVKHITEFNYEFDLFLIRYGSQALGFPNIVDEIVIPRNPFLASCLLKRYNLDLIHYNPLTIFSPIWLKGVKKTAGIYGLSQRFLKDCYSPLHIAHHKLISPKYARHMHMVFTISKTSRDFIAKYYGVSNRKIRIAYAAVDESFSTFDKSSKFTAKEFLKRNYDINSPFILHVSRFSERKNPWTILRGFNNFVRTYSTSKEFILVLAGNGWNNKLVNNFARKLKIENKVKYLGFVKKNIIVKLMNIAEIFVFPSLYEGCGMPNLEAMACSCPVITSNVFAIPEIVGDAALIMDKPTDFKELSNKLHILIKDQGLRNRLIQRGQERIKLYSWSDSTRTVLSAYKECLEIPNR